ncbi:hypothetical protein AB0P28_15170 [Pseudarthrobacter sp. NPDC089323]
MTLSELKTGLESLNEGYREVADQLSMDDPEAYARVMDVLHIWAEALSPDYDFLSTYEDSVLREEKAIKGHNEVVEQLGNALRQRDSKNIVIWSGYLLSTLHKYVAKVGRTAWDKAARCNSHGGCERG